MRDNKSGLERMKEIEMSMGDVETIETIKDGIVRIKGLANVKANEMLRIQTRSFSSNQEAEEKNVEQILSWFSSKGKSVIKAKLVELKIISGLFGNDLEELISKIDDKYIRGEVTSDITSIDNIKVEVKQYIYIWINWLFNNNLPKYLNEKHLKITVYVDSDNLEKSNINNFVFVIDDKIAEKGRLFKADITTGFLNMHTYYDEDEDYISIINFQKEAIEAIAFIIKNIIEVNKNAEIYKCCVVNEEGKVEFHPANMTENDLYLLVEAINQILKEEDIYIFNMSREIQKKRERANALYDWFSSMPGKYIVEGKSLELSITDTTDTTDTVKYRLVGKWDLLVNWLLIKDLPKYLQNSELKIKVYVDSDNLEKLNKLVIDQRMFWFWFNNKEEILVEGEYEDENNEVEKKAIEAILKIIEMLLRYNIKGKGKGTQISYLCIVDKEGKVEMRLIDGWDYNYIKIKAKDLFKKK